MRRSGSSRVGVRARGLSRDEIATRALHTTSDFPQILAAVTGKTLRDAYEAAPRTFGPIARRVAAADFKDTRLGRAAIAAACSLTQLQIVPAMALSR